MGPMRLLIGFLLLPFLASCGRVFCLGPLGGPDCQTAATNSGDLPSSSGLHISVSPTLYQSVGPVPRGTVLTLTAKNGSGSYIWTVATASGTCGSPLTGTAGINPGSFSGGSVTYTAPSTTAICTVTVQDATLKTYPVSFQTQ